MQQVFFLKVRYRESIKFLNADEMLHSALSSFVSNRKGFEYTIDEKIPSGRLLRIALGRLSMYCNGKLSGISNKGWFFLSPNCKITNRHKLKLGYGVTIERQVCIEALSRDGIILGNNVSVGRGTWIQGTGNLKHLGKGLLVGNNVGLGTHCFYGCSGGIEIGDDTIVGYDVSFHAENHRFEDVHKPIRLQGVRHQGILIGKNCWIGARSVILDGAVIEEGCIIAAGAVVTSGRYEANSIYGGIPARLIKPRINNSNYAAI
jgi:acetyltransferase-like isoleucine patch superfamily enzyme